MLFRCLTTGVFSALAAMSVLGAEDRPLESIEITGLREAVREHVQSFVGKVTRKEGDLIARWRDSLCPSVTGLSESQAAFVRGRLLEVEAKVRERAARANPECRPNLFIIVTDDVESVLTGWKERDPRLFRWKSPEDISRSDDAGPVRIWHNAIMLRSDDGPWVMDPTRSTRAPSGRLKDSRIQSSAKEAITAVVVLLDASKMAGVNLAQTADYLAMVSLSQVDLRADLGATNTILRLFVDRTGAAPSGLTEWDYAFLNALYRVGYYSPEHQRMDITARMVRELAPR